ncbi:MAG: hypothetical protein HQL13_06220 [Candidatus Omnitrophica bacterium]|nr:hypothetical protein [Candidatus Omnitrophota bacterium]
MAKTLQGAVSLSVQWTLNVEEEKIKAQGLLVERDRLEAEYNRLDNQVEELKLAVSTQLDANNQVGISIQTPKPRPEKGGRVADLTQEIKDKRQQLKSLEGQERNMAKEKASLERKTRQLYDEILRVRDRQQGEKQRREVRPQQQEPADDEGLNKLRQQLEEEMKQEVVLSNQLKDLKNGVSTS